MLSILFQAQKAPVPKCTNIIHKSSIFVAHVQLLDRVDLMMATRYVQDISEQVDRVIANSRKCFPAAKTVHV